MTTTINNQFATGKDVNYYLLTVSAPKRLAPYKAEAEDIIEGLKMSFAEGNVLKALWRSCAANSLNVVKPGADAFGVYDAEKMVYYSQRVLAQRKAARGDAAEETVENTAVMLAPKPSYNMGVFVQDIFAMNTMYKLPVSETPTDFPGEPIYDRMPKFMQTLHEEIDEGDNLYAASLYHTSTTLELVVEVADLLGDIVVYAFSEALKYGIPLLDVLQIIMQSNASKLGADGKPIYDANGKFLKGPNYWKPEPKIKQLIDQRMAIAREPKEWC